MGRVCGLGPRWAKTHGVRAAPAAKSDTMPAAMARNFMHAIIECRANAAATRI